MKLHGLAANCKVESEFVEQKNGGLLWVRVKCWLCLLH